ncbi:DUF6896 domain-containing protein [Streptomyces cyaneofuscatus]|uniref:DUF6896 domain-containing protein n=1 Tax=Streptomyces cyaneofuscatus TaxID=66883 RepID=UPI003830F4A5
MATTARDLVIGYAHDLGAARTAMRAAVPGLDRLADLLGLVRSHRISRRGEAGSYAYVVHGAGCRLTGPDGTDIDVDFTADGTEIFDLWRLGCYGRSLPEPLDPTAEELRSAVESLGPLLTEVRPGWFTTTTAGTGSGTGTGTTA